jgi:dynein heavy chain
MILGSRFVKPLRIEAEEWKKNILTISDMVEQWQTCQMSWRYLENIFKALDIRKAMPDETKKFEQVDKSFKLMMIKAQKQPVIIKIIKMKPFKTLDELTTNNQILEEV